MFDAAAYWLVGSFGVMAVLLLADELRHRYFQPRWACSQCAAGPLEANGPVSVFDGCKGFRCPSCGHSMQTYRSRFVLFAQFLMCLAITAGCAIIVLLDWDPAGWGLSSRFPFMLMCAGILFGPVGAFLCLRLMRKSMPVPFSKKEM